MINSLHSDEVTSGGVGGDSEFMEFMKNVDSANGGEVSIYDMIVEYDVSFGHFFLYIYPSIYLSFYLCISFSKNLLV
jgi:hypothetical protein